MNKFKVLKTMKKIFIAAFVFLISNAIVGQTKKYVSFEANIANKNGDVISIISGNKLSKKITVDKSGIFRDTLNVKEGMYMLFDGVEYTSLYLKNGFDLKLTMDAKRFDESIVYSGIGAGENNFLAQKAISDSKDNVTQLLSANEVEFKKIMKDKKASDFKKLEDSKLDENFIKLEKANIEADLKGFIVYYNQKKANNKLNNIKSPSFDYVNFAGTKTKLEDFAGKYVYIDVWATWCGPCRAEIPFLKKTEERYEGKSIEFVSISIDVKKDFDKWKKFVGDKKLGGTQVIADNNWTSEFIKQYNIQSIPRFILIDPKGNVVSADAPRPSDPMLTEILDKLLK